MRARQVNQYTANGILTATFPTVRAAAEKAGVSVTLICNCLTGKQKMVGEFIYQYADQARGSQTCRPSDEPLKMYEKIRAYAISLCHCTEMADDLVQEAYTQYYEKFVEDGSSSAYSFLTSQVKWQFYNEAERHQQETDIEALEYCISSEQEDIEEVERRKANESRMLNKMVKGVFATIKTEKRRKRFSTLFVWYLQGMSAAEVSSKLNIGIPSAKQEIMKMRRFVTTGLGIGIREFTQYNCRLA